VNHAGTKAKLQVPIVFDRGVESHYDDVVGFWVTGALPEISTNTVAV
jgi:hypothetical protein